MAWTENNSRRLGPVNAILAVDDRETLFWTPGEPHPITPGFRQNGYVETGAVLTAHDRIALVFGPPAGRGSDCGSVCRLVKRAAHVLECLSRRDESAVGEYSQALPVTVMRA